VEDSLLHALSRESIKGPEQHAIICFRGGAAPSRARGPSQQSTASNGYARRGLTSRGGRAKMGRVLSKGRLDKGNLQRHRVYPDQTSRGREGSNHDVMSGWADTVNSKVAPWGTFVLARSRPPCASMIDRQIDRPIPKPPDFVV